jgi:hypothetical protein
MASVHKQLANGFRLKVTIDALGLYINGFRVLNGRGEHKWWVIPPQQRAGPRYIDILEFDKSYDLWTDIENACIQAVEEYSPESVIPEMTEDELNKFMSNEIDNKFNEMDKNKEDDDESSKAISWLKD